MSLVIDTKFFEVLTARLLEIETSAIAKLPNALPYDQYQQSCGYLEAIRQIRETLIPEVMEEIQRS